MLCKRCGDKQARDAGFCPGCYAAERKGYKTRKERMAERNYIKDGVGHLTDTRGNTWLVDLDDFEACRKFLWINNGNGYARTYKVGYLHRFIMPGYSIVDHIDGDPSNCRKSNLRDGSKGINTLNTHKRKVAKSGFRGVHRMRHRWQGVIVLSGAKHYIGTFDTPKEAAREVYRVACQHGRGEFYTAFD